MFPVLDAVLALASAADEQPPAQSPLPTLLMFAAMAAVFYFIVFRPQQKQAKQLREYIAGLKRGDEVVTQGGLVGTVVLVEDRTVTLDLGAGTKVRVLKGHVSGAFQEKPAAAGAQEKK